MWVRPEYVAVVGQRAGVPSYYEWDGPRLAREARDAGVDFIVVTTLYKSDLGRQKGSPAARLADIERFAARRRVLVNPVTREEEYLLLEVDRGALDAYLAGRV
jgi:hypothetical protein